MKGKIILEEAFMTPEMFAREAANNQELYASPTYNKKWS